MRSLDFPSPRTLRLLKPFPSAGRMYFCSLRSYNCINASRSQVKNMKHLAQLVKLAEEAGGEITVDFKTSNVATSRACLLRGTEHWHLQTGSRKLLVPPRCFCVCL
jgi:hypothetical protein